MQPVRVDLFVWTVPGLGMAGTCESGNPCGISLQDSPPSGAGILYKDVLKKEAEMEKKDRARRTYKKPQVHQVRLVIEEAVLQGCRKSTSETAEVNRTCDHPGCKRLGS